MRAFHVLFVFAIAACAKSSDMPPPEDDAGTPGDAPMLTILGGTCGGTGVTFQWNEIKGATYVLEYWLVNQPPTMVELPAGTTTYMSPKLAPGMYQANIKAKLASGDTPFSMAKSFSVVQGKQSSFTQMSQVDFAMNTNMGVFVATDGVVLSSMADGGNGSDGMFNSGSDTMIQDTRNYTTFTIPQGVKVTAGGTNPLVIKAQGAVQIDGTLTASGPNGGNGVTFNTYGKGGIGTGGGGSGGDGVFVGGPSNGNDGSGPGAGLKGTNWQGGSGAGFAAQGGSSPQTQWGSGITGGPAYGTADLMMLQGGSGGGGGSGGSNCGSGGGGAGGGAIEIMSAVSITINGTISSDGGNGGSDGTGNCGGGGAGSGGAIWLRAPTITNNGSISAVGGMGGASNIGTKGGTGSVGRIRIDANNGMVMGNINPMAGFTGNLPFASTGTTVSTPIAPQGLCAWGKVTYSIDTTAMGTSINVDVVDANNMVIAPNVMNGADLSTIPAVAGAKAIKLKATLATQNATGSPKLTSWKVEYFTQ